MLELSSRLKNHPGKTDASPEVERFMATDRSRTQQMIDRSPLKANFDVSRVLRDLQDRFSYTDNMSNEIEEMIEAQVEVRTRELFRQANYDDLTHLPNRAYFHSTLEELVVRAKQREGEFTLLFLDLDGFKNVNDTFGHHAGDELLRNVSARLISAVREGDIVSRLGGDEFVVLLSGLSDREMIEGICKRMIGEVRRPYWIDQNDIQISTSIGVACYPMDAKSSTELIEKSDKALYLSKDNGRNTFSFYGDVVESEENSAENLVSRLESALEQGQIKICFEPQVDLVSHEIVGSSVTALWMENRSESPYLSGWADVLNQSSWSHSIGAWLIDSGLYYLQQWQKIKDELVISIPVTQGVCQQEELVSFMNRRVAAYQVKASQVQLEFSLQAVMDEALQNQLNALSEAGYQITLTEVGKAPLNLTELSQLSLHEIKLDAKWLKDSLTTQNGQKWLKAIIQMAKVLDICVIATGIESQEEVDQLQSLGCFMGQGILWALPLEAEGFYQALSVQLPAVH